MRGAERPTYNGCMRDDDLSRHRRSIDDIDRELVRLLGRRRQAVLAVARIKAATEQSALQREREAEIVATRRRWADAEGLDPEHADELFRLLMDQACRDERDAGAG